MTRFLLVGLLLVILRLAVKNFTAQLKGAVFGPPTMPPPPTPPRAVTKTLVPCARCGTYVPAERVDGEGVCEACRA
ncbi:MAG: hypothetical protein ACJ75H_02925 [Thermoanaerobaculia bacterium]